MLVLFLLFASAAAQCDTSTCNVCKNMTGCDWYGNFACYNKTSDTVTKLNIPATATCDVCQAGSCDDCHDQGGCSWFTNTIPGAPGKCESENYTSSLYKKLDMCPVCNAFTTCDACSTANATCGWYVLPGGVSGKCREAAPTFAYSKVKLGFCSGDPCGGQNGCTKCKGVKLDNDTDALCAWFTSKSPSFYSSKCDDAEGGVLSTAFYTQESTCPVCAGTSCLDCKAEANCKWVSVSLGVGTAFGQCLPSSTATPTGKTEVSTCPSSCKLHSCTQCQTNPDCSWFTGSSFIDDSCDLTTDAKIQHPTQSIATTCPKCGADRCFECNGLTGCGWYANIQAGITFAEGCYPTDNFPSGRKLISNDNSKCDGVASGSAHVAVSMAVLAVLALVA